MSTYMVSVVLYDWTYLTFSKYYFDRFRCVLDRIFCFLNYRIISVIFIFDNIVLFSFPIKKNVKVKVVEPFADYFRPFSSQLTIGLGYQATQPSHIRLYHI